MAYSKLFYKRISIKRIVEDITSAITTIYSLSPKEYNSHLFRDIAIGFKSLENAMEKNEPEAFPLFLKWLKLYVKIQHQISSKNGVFHKESDLKIPVCSSYILASLQYQTKIANYHQQALEMCLEIFKSTSPATIRAIAHCGLQIIALLWTPVKFVGDYITQRLCIKLIEIVLKPLDIKQRYDKINEIKVNQSIQNLLLELAASSEDKFEDITRDLLNKYNMTVARNCTVFSVYCVSALFGNFELFKPEKVENFWIDFNYTSKSVSLLCRINTSDRKWKELSIKILIEKLQIKNELDCVVYSAGPAIFSTDVSPELKRARVAVFTLPSPQLEFLKMNKDLLDFYNAPPYNESEPAPTPNTIDQFLGESTPYAFDNFVEDITSPNTIENFLNEPNTPDRIENNSPSREKEQMRDNRLSLLARNNNDFENEYSDVHFPKQTPIENPKSDKTKNKSFVNFSELSHASDSFIELTNTFRSNKESGYNTCVNSTANQNTTVFKKPSELKQQKPTQLLHQKPKELLNSATDGLSDAHNKLRIQEVIVIKSSSNKDKSAPAPGYVEPLASSSFQTSGIFANQHQNSTKTQTVKPVQKQNTVQNLKGKSSYTSTPLQTSVNPTQPFRSEDKAFSKPPVNMQQENIEFYLHPVQVSLSRTSRTSRNKKVTKIPECLNEEEPITSRSLQSQSLKSPKTSNNTNGLSKRKKFEETPSGRLSNRRQSSRETLPVFLDASWQTLGSTVKISGESSENCVKANNKPKHTTTQTTKTKPKSARKKPVKNANSKTGSKEKRINAVKPLNHLTKSDCDPKEAAVECIENGGINTITKYIGSKAGSQHFTEGQRKQILQNMKIIQAQNKYQLRNQTDKGSDTNSNVKVTPKKRTARKRKSLAKAADLSNFVSYSSWKQTQKNKARNNTLPLTNPEKENKLPTDTELSRSQPNLFDMLKEFDSKSISSDEECSPRCLNEMTSAEIQNEYNDYCGSSASSYSNHNFYIAESENEQENTENLGEKIVIESPEPLRADQPDEGLQSPVGVPSELFIVSSPEGSPVSELREDYTIKREISPIYEDIPDNSSDSSSSETYILSQIRQPLESELFGFKTDESTPSPLVTMPNDSWCTENRCEQLTEHQPTSSQGTPVSVALSSEVNQNDRLPDSLQDNTTNRVMIHNHLIVSSNRKRFSLNEYTEAPLAKMVPTTFYDAKTLNDFAHLLPTYKEKISIEKDKILNELEQNMNANVFDSLYEAAKEVTDSITNHETAIKETQEEIGRLECLMENLKKNKSYLEHARSKVIGLLESSTLEEEVIDQIFKEAEERLTAYSESLKKDLWKEFSKDIVSGLIERIHDLADL